MASDPSAPTAVSETLNEDPLSEETRKNRRMLLGVSTLGFAVSAMHLVPTRIDAFGIELSEPAGAFPILLSAVTFYFVLAFLLSAAPEYLLWFGRHAWVQYSTTDAALRALQESVKKEISGHPQPEGASITRLMTTLHELRFWSKWLAAIRFAFDAVLPIVLAGLSIWWLTTSPVEKPEAPVPPTPPTAASPNSLDQNKQN